MEEAKTARRIGIMGGSFDPVHLGHLVCAEEALWQFNLDEVIWVPAGNPWQKRHVSSAEDRYMMVVVATGGHAAFSVSRIEMDRSGPTYTIETLKAFQQFHGDAAELFFITGADAVLQILTWKDPGEALQVAHFIAANRPNYELAAPELDKFGNRVSVMTIPGLEISSTDIRRRVADGRPIRYLVPEGVAEYIYERGLYLELRESA